MTPDELVDAKARLTKLEAAYDDLISGARTAEFRYQDMSEKFHPADTLKLEARIARLKREIDRAEGRPSGAMIVRF